MNRSDFATPGAVLLGSALIAWVLARGLDKIAQAEARRGDAVRSVAAATPARSAPKTAPDSPKPEIDESRVRSEEQAEFAFVRQQPDYVRACWKPTPVPAGSQPDFGGAFEFDLSFDANGKETKRVMRTGGYAKPALADCVRKLSLPGISIPAPGHEITVTVNFPIP